MTARNLWRLAFAGLALCLASLAFAQGGPFGVGPKPPADAQPVSGLAAWLLVEQARFHRALTGAISNVVTNPTAFLSLIGLAFSYGVLHAIGPGHGKAVIASYLVANETALRRGVALSFGAAAVQALIALLLVGIVAGIMGRSGPAMTGIAASIETAGFAIIALMGLWIAARKGRAMLAPAGSLEAACEDPFCAIDHHGGDPRMLARTSVRDLFLTAIGAGIRPCAGAIILLVFALTKGLFLAGALSVLAMAIGTAIGTSIFALIAVKAKMFALRLIAGRGSSLRRIGLFVEMLAGLLLAAFGAALLTGAMAGTT